MRHVEPGDIGHDGLHGAAVAVGVVEATLAGRGALDLDNLVG